MKKKEIKKLLSKGPAPKRMLETQQMCLDLLNEQVMNISEEHTGFWIFLTDIFRHVGLRLWGMQLIMLLFVCAGLLAVPNAPNAVPIFTPLFILACIPSLFQNQSYGMCEIEAATRASGAQIVLAKLTLAGAADLICLSITIVMVAATEDFSANIVQLILYAVVPLLACIVVTLWCIRKCKRNAMQISVLVCLASSMAAICLAHWMPKLYVLSSLGLWFIALITFTLFFAREIYLLLQVRKDGKIYGVIS